MMLAHQGCAYTEDASPEAGGAMMMMAHQECAYTEEGYQVLALRLAAQ